MDAEKNIIPLHFKSSERRWDPLREKILSIVTVKNNKLNY